MIDTGLLIAGIITGLTQVVKKTGLIPDNWLPLVAVLIGGILGYLILGHDAMSVAIGLFSGLVTTGMVSAIKGEINKVV